MPLEPNPGYPARLRAARERLGLSRAEVERRASLPAHTIAELEAYPDELTSSLTLRDLAALCGALGLEPAGLVARPGESLPAESVLPEALARAVRARMAAAGLTPQAFGDQAGWAVEQLLDDPVGYVAALNVDGLFDICAAAGVPWLAALPAAISRVGA